LEIIMIVSLWVGRRGAPSKVGFDHVGDDGTRLGEVEGGDGRIHLARIMHHASRFCAPAWRAQAIDPSVWIGVRQLAVQRVWD
jgi:hypothetical protein